MKPCRHCGVEQPLTAFHKNARYRDGLQSQCKDCIRALHYTPNKEARLADSRRRRAGGGQARDNAAAMVRRRENPLVRMVQEAKVRAKKRGLPFDITAADLSVPELCPVLGIPIGMSYGRRSDQSLSLERIDCAKGYVRGNVLVISWRANRLKSDATLDEMERITAFYRTAANT